MKDEEEQKDIKGLYPNTKVEFYQDVKPQWPLKEEQGDQKDGFKSDDKSTLSASRPAETNVIPGLPLAPSLEDDDDFDVNDFPIYPMEPLRNDDGATNMVHAMDEGQLVEDDRRMRVDQPTGTLEDVGRPFKGEMHQTTAVKKELRDDLSLLDLRPVKRQRLEFDGVLLPSPAEVRQRWASEEVKPAQANPSHEIEEMNKNVESWRNPKMKKQENFEMDPGVTSRRLLAAGINELLDLRLEDDLKDILVSRKFMSQRFGGSAQNSMPSIAQANFEKHGFKHFLYCNPSVQPMAPQIEGASGLFFDPDQIEGFTGGGVTYKLFTRLRTTPRAEWMYLGDYETIEAQPLSKAEWNEQEGKVKRKWANMISTDGWGSPVRKRISARKKYKCRNPTQEQLKNISDKPGGVTADEIHRAFDCGDEFLRAWVLKCVGFDKSLQRQVKEELKTWKP